MPTQFAVGDGRPRGVKPTPWQDRFWRFVAPGAADDCWEWTGSRDQHGYGKLARGGKHGGSMKAHRASYEIHVGPIPAAMAICHRCDNPPCVNPGHLELGTLGDNSRDMAAKGRSGAQRGHDNGRTRLSDEQVRALRVRAAAGVDYVELAGEFGCAAQYASELARGNRRLRAGGPITEPRPTGWRWR